MAWSIRDGKSYYYQHLRRDGKVIRRYVGGGAVGRLAAELDERDRLARQERLTVRKAQVTRLQFESRRMNEIQAEADQAIRMHLLDHGYYHRNRAVWRRRGKMKTKPPTTPPDQLATLTTRDLIERANGGDPAALAALRKYLDDHPEIWRHVGDLAKHQMDHLLREIGGTGPQACFLVECVRRKTEELRQSLLPENPLPVHELAVERVVLSHVELHFLDAQQPKSPQIRRRSPSPTSERGRRPSGDTCPP